MRLALVSLLCLVLAGPAFAKSSRLTFIYVRGGNSSTLMSGVLDDLERVRKALGKQDRALWVRTADDKEYIIRDAATLDELERLWKPANELAQQLGKLGAEQGKLGEQLGKLGEQQGKLGEQQGRIGEQQGRLAEHQGRLAEKLANATDAQRTALEREMRDLGPVKHLRPTFGVRRGPLRANHSVRVRAAA